jgi:hypothetical protein
VEICPPLTSSRAEICTAARRYEVVQDYYVGVREDAARRTAGGMGDRTAVRATLRGRENPLTGCIGREGVPLEYAGQDPCRSLQGWHTTRALCPRGRSLREHNAAARRLEAASHTPQEPCSPAHRLPSAACARLPPHCPEPSTPGAPLVCEATWAPALTPHGAIDTSTFTSPPCCSSARQRKVK